jgi:putative ABC transport system permease protein
MRIYLRDAVRALLAGRGTTVLAFTILTLAMAAGTVTFSVVDAVALRPLPYGSPDRLVGISLQGMAPGTVAAASPRDYFTWLDGTRAFTAIAASRPLAPSRLEFRDGAETLTTRAVSANLFDVLDVRPAAGRWFGPEHERPGGPAAVILSHRLWVRRFGADAGVVGRLVTIGPVAREVIGVLPPDIAFPIGGSPSDLYVPHIVTPAERANARSRSLSVVGRLRAGMTVEQARADVVRVSTVAVTVLPLHDQVVGSGKRWLLFALAAVGLVLLIACANVATLFLVRATTRARELATREVLGASRAQLARGLLLEGLILSFASAAAAMLVSFWGVELAKSNVPPGLLTRVSTIAVDARVLSAAIAAAVACALVFATAPAWLTVRADLLDRLKAAGGPLISGRHVDRWLGAFLVAELAVVSVLLVATTLAVSSFILIAKSDLGFDRQNLMTIDYERVFDGGSDASRSIAVATFRRNLLNQVQSVPGVASAAISTNGTVPMSGGGVRYSIVIPGVGETLGEDLLETRTVTPDYFRTMDMQLARGRLFTPDDRAGAPPVMLINEVAAQRFFPDRDPVGQVVTFRGPTTIVGVLHAVRFDGPEAAYRPEMYIPADQERLRGAREFGSLIVRANRNPRQVAAAVRDAIRPAIGTEPAEAQFVDDFFHRLTAGRRFNAGVMAVFGVIAVALAAIGIHGTMAFLVARQVPAIGLRLALGASPSRILRSVMSSALRRVGLGVAIGLAAAWATSSAITSFVFGIRPTDPYAYAAVISIVALVSAIAAIVPAIRAARLDPSTALRRE